MTCNVTNIGYYKYTVQQTPDRITTPGNPKKDLILVDTPNFFVTRDSTKSSLEYKLWKAISDRIDTITYSTNPNNLSIGKSNAKFVNEQKPGQLLGPIAKPIVKTMLERSTNDKDGTILLAPRLTYIKTTTNVEYLPVPRLFANEHPPPPIPTDVGLFIPYRKIDPLYYWSMYIYGGAEPGEPGSVAGDPPIPAYEFGLSVRWSTTKLIPNDESFSIVNNLTEYCTSTGGKIPNTYSYGSTPPKLNEWCCNGTGGQSDGTCGPVQNFSFLFGSLQIPMQTDPKEKPPPTHPNGDSNGGCDSDCHTKSSTNIPLALGLSLGVVLPIFVVISYFIYKKYKM